MQIRYCALTTWITTAKSRLGKVPVSIFPISQSTERQEKTLSPTWDQTLIFEEMEIPGDPSLIKSQPPDITISGKSWLSLIKSQPPNITISGKSSVSLFKFQPPDITISAKCSSSLAFLLPFLWSSLNRSILLSQVSHHFLSSNSTTWYYYLR